MVGWVQMRSYNPNFTKVFDGVFCKMMAVFPCRSGASQNPLNLRASRFENTCEKFQSRRIQAMLLHFSGAWRTARGDTRCRCPTRFKFGSREFDTLPVVAGGQSSAFRSISDWIARPSAATCASAGSKVPTISTAGREAAYGLAPASLVTGLPAGPRPSPRRFADPGRPVVDLFIWHLSRQA